MSITVIGVMLLAGLSIGGILYALFYGQIKNEQQSAKRLQALKTGGSIGNGLDGKSEAGKRRKQVTDALEDLEAKNKARDKDVNKPPLKTLLKQAGIKMDVKRFYVIQAAIGVVSFLLFLVFGAGLLIALGAGFAFGFGLPRWFAGFLRKRRMNKFLLELPNAIDIIVRAIKSGLPLNDGLRLIAAEAKEPVRTEFQRIVEAQQLGISTPDACLRMYKTMPVTEANFFAVVIQIQQQAGGNLAEALGNLSNVLRARKSMKAKVSAMSMEAKASGAIIGVLPFVVAILTYITSPDYIMPLFTTDTGNLILAASGIWMGIGIFVMKQMISFEV
ncbi:MAG: type II secretion system F family protein [Ahrensia sp.]